MRLLYLDDRGTPRLEEFLGDNIPYPYAILSHTWRRDGGEVLYRDIVDGTAESKAGYEKIRFCGAKAASYSLKYFWVDTCCIDKSSSADLSEAITSMFRWYHNAAKCYVFLSDVSLKTGNHDPSQQWELSFRKSIWFTRGWTLQELIAPRSVEFYSQEGERLGDKKFLEQQIHEITRVPIQVLRGAPLSGFSVDERMLWAAERETTRKEDKAYCLLGIFNVYLVPNYGEGEYAFSRLKKEIQASFAPNSSNDEKVLKFRQLLLEFDSSKEGDPMTPNLNKVDQSFSSHWEEKSRACIQNFRPDHAENISINNSWDDVQEQISRGGNRPALMGLSRNLNHMKVFIDAVANNVESGFNLSVLWGYIWLIIKCTQVPKTSSTPSLRMLQQICHKIEVLNSYCIHKSIVIPRTMETCFEIALALLDFFSNVARYIIQNHDYRWEDNGKLEQLAKFIFDDLDDAISRIQKISESRGRLPNLNQLEKLLTMSGLL